MRRFTRPRRTTRDHHVSISSRARLAAACRLQVPSSLRHLLLPTNPPPGNPSVLPLSISKRYYSIFLSHTMDGKNLPMGDKLVLRGLKFHGFHGVKPEEKKLGQKFLVDVDAWLDLHQAGKTDCLSDTISYTDIYRIVKDIVEGPSQNLLESVAQLIANTTLLKFPEISAVHVTVGKPHVAVQGSLDYLGVEILRFREVDRPA